MSYTGAYNRIVCTQKDFGLKVNPLENIEDVLAEVQRRWGSKSIRKARELPDEQRILPSGIAPLDILLAGGLLRGKITDFIGKPTSGITTLAYRLIAYSGIKGGESVFIDLPRTFNGAYAADCGVDLERLLVARPSDSMAALELTRDIASSQVVSLVIIDLGHSSEQLRLDRLHHLLAASPTALLLLSQTPVHGSHVRVEIRCCGWLHDERDVVGCNGQAMLQRHPRLAVGRIINFELIFGKGADYA